MKTVWFWQFHLKTASEGNLKEHWTKSHKRHKKQKDMIKKVFMVEKPQIKPPCKVTLTRVAPRQLDAHDNLPISLKWVSDAIAEYLVPDKAAGRADDCKDINWNYDQKKGNVREYGVYVLIETL